MAAGNGLMDEIYDQFLLCKICYEIYKRPKTLVCLHTFCADCLEKHQDAEVERSYRYMLYSRAISCPICRKKTELPSGGVCRLPDNFLVENLTDVINRSRPSSQNQSPCEICKSKRLAISKCLDCSKLLCDQCVDIHKKTKVTAQHSIFDIEVEKDIKCKVHSDEVVRFYCEPCEVCICVLCTFQEHKSHEVSSFQDGIKKYSHCLDSLMEACRQRMAGLKDQLHLINRCENAIKKNEQHIRDMAIDSITAIRKKECQMTQDLHELYGTETIEFIKHREPIQENIDTLQSTYNLTDIILKDKSIELLLLRKEIEDKINFLLGVQPDAIPENLLKDIRFIPGNFAFGYLNVEGEEPPNTPDFDDVEQKLLAIKKGLLQSVDTQTEKSSTRERYTTMEALVFRCDIDQPTQTDIVEVSDAGITVSMNTATSVMSKSACTMVIPEATDKHTMTFGPAMTRRKTQTERVSHANQMTWTMKIRTADQSVSTTDLGFDVDVTSQQPVMKPTVCDSETMTPQTPTMPRKMQTESVQQLDQTTATTELDVIDKCTNTNSNSSCDKGTLTKKRSCGEKSLSTDGLVVLQHQETCTPEKRLRAASTLTDHIAFTNRATLTHQPTLSDKSSGPPGVVQFTQETNTNVIHNMDVGITARSCGTDVSTGTRNVVLADAGSGEHHLNITDTGTDPWLDILPNNEPSKSPCSEKPKTKSKGNFTNFFNMKTKNTETESMHQDSKAVSTNTDSMLSRDVDTCTTLLETNDAFNDVQNDVFVIRVAQSDSCCQTEISLKENIAPCDKDTDTTKTHTIDNGTVTDTTKLEDVSIMHLPEMTTISTNTKMANLNNCSTNTELTTQRDAETTTKKLALKSKSTSTVKPKVKHSDTNTAQKNFQDSSNDAYKGELEDVGTNTDPCVVKPLVSMLDIDTNTQPIECFDQSTAIEIDVSDTGCDPALIEQYSVMTCTEQQSTLDSFTTMSSTVETSEFGMNTLQTKYQDMKCGETLEVAEASTSIVVATAESANGTDKLQTKSTKTGTKNKNYSDQTTEMAVIDVCSTGSNPIFIHGDNKETATETPQFTDIGTGMPTAHSLNKSTSTIKQKHRDTGTSAFVPVVEKATYMPTVITMESATLTQHAEFSTKRVNTDMLQNDDAATMTVQRKCIDQDTTMESTVHVEAVGIATETREMVDTGTDPKAVKIKSRSTGTPVVKHGHVETNTPVVTHATTETTTGHRVDVADKQEGAAVGTQEAETFTDSVVMKSKGTAIVIETSDKSNMKKPRTTTRGVHSRRLHTLSQSTATEVTNTHEAMCMTDRPHINDKAIQAKMTSGVDGSTHMTPILSQDANISTIPIPVGERGTSPLDISTQERACSPETIEFCNRPSSPILTETCDQKVGIRPETLDSDTNTQTVVMNDSSSMTSKFRKKVKKMRNTRSSPISDLLLIPRSEVGTAMDQIETVHRSASPILPTLESTSMNTENIESVDRGVTPIHIALKDKGSMIQADMQEKAVTTDMVETVEKGVSVRTVATLNAQTSTTRVKCREKETSTTKIQVMHKTVSTDITQLEDRGTMTPSDVKFGYLESLLKSAPITFCRGTTTDLVVTETKQTSPPPLNTADKSSSPTRVFTKDKATMARKGEIIEPVDTYQAPGVQKRPKRPIFDSPRSSLEIITEEAKDSSSDEDSKKKTRIAKSRSVGSIPLNLENIPSPKRFNKHQLFFTPPTMRLSKPPLLAPPMIGKPNFLPSTSPTNEAGTNTREVGMTSCGTSTSNIDTADKAICTEAISLNGKMAECISKLKNVSQRLEPPAHQPVYVTATSRASSTPCTTQSSQHPTSAILSPVLHTSPTRGTDTRGGQPILSPPAMVRHRRAPPSPGSDSSCSDQEQVSPRQKMSLARKQRLNINQLLRSASLPDNKPQPVVPPKLTVRTVQRQVIPKLDILDSDEVKPIDDVHSNLKKTENDVSSEAITKDGPATRSPSIEAAPSSKITKLLETGILTRSVDDIKQAKPTGQVVLRRPNPKPKDDPTMKPPIPEHRYKSTEQQPKTDVRPKIPPRLTSPKGDHVQKSPKEAVPRKPKEDPQKNKETNPVELKPKSPSFLRRSSNLLKLRKNSDPTPVPKIKTPKTKENKKQVQASYDVFKDLLFGRTKHAHPEPSSPSKSLPPTPKLRGRKSLHLPGNFFKRDKHKDEDSSDMMTSSQESK